MDNGKGRVYHPVKRLRLFIREDQDVAAQKGPQFASTFGLQE
jgi:hypothetical protein